MKLSKEKIDSIVEKAIDNKKIFGAVLTLSRGDETIVSASGLAEPEGKYFIASVTKLYTASIIFNLVDNGKLSLDDPAYKYLPEDIVEGLHILRGTDFSREITIRHLLSNTSGLPDYFEEKTASGKSLMQTLASGEDIRWTPREAAELAKTLRPKFSPGKKGKAYYSDTNFQLLAMIIEKIERAKLGEILREYIFKPLKLDNTYLFEDVEDDSPAKIYSGSKAVRIPMAMKSFGADGGIVSTSEESVRFIKAYFDGKLFDKRHFERIFIWNKIYFPFQYGLGVARFKLPAFFKPFFNVFELVGHHGASGSFAYYCAEKDAYAAGTINQIKNPGAPYSLLFKALSTI